MTDRQIQLVSSVDVYKDKILEAERYTWNCPELGFQEWKTTAYFKKLFEDLGYTIQGPTDIPGFYVDIDTGIPGPKVLVMGELDALPANGHPEAIEGCVHSCGHHVQSVCVYGVAAALKQPHALDGMCGSIRLMLVPAEESDATGYREQLRKDGIIVFYNGKMEFMRRGYMDGCDMALMLHALGLVKPDFACDTLGCNGYRSIKAKFIGKSIHGSRPDLGINALNAANLAINAINALKDTFLHDDRVVLTAAITDPGIGTIPGEVEISIGIRAVSLDAINKADKKITQAVFASAAAIGATVEIYDAPGYDPLRPDTVLLSIAQDCMEALSGKEKVDFSPRFNPGGTDMGNLSTIIPCIHPFVSGVSGSTHASNFYVTDPVRACVNGAKAELLIVDSLLSNGASKAKQVMAHYQPLAIMDEYLSQSEALFAKRVSHIHADGDMCRIELICE